MSYRKYDPVWKRWETVPSAVDDGLRCYVRIRNSIIIKSKQTSRRNPEETQEWYETELKWWGDRQLHIVAIAVVIQMSALFMGAIILLNQQVFG